MKDPKSKSIDQSDVDALPQFGKPKFVFLPSYGQTTVGVAIGLVIAIIGFICCLFPDGMKVGGICFITGIGLAYWLWEQRKWKLLICPQGVIQTNAWGTKELRWSEMTEIIAIRVKSPNGTLREVTVVTSSAKTKIGGHVNCRNWQQALEEVLKSAKRRGVPTSVFVVPYPD